MLLPLALLVSAGCFPQGGGLSEIDSHETEMTTKPDKATLEALREDFDLGSCRNLRGDVVVILFYPDDAESRWTADEIQRFTENEVMPGLRFLEKEAARYGVSLRFRIEAVYSSLTYRGDLINDVRSEGYATADVLKQMAKALHYSSDADMLYVFRNAYQTQEVVCLTVFNKDGTAYAINPKRQSETKAAEHCILFARDRNIAVNGAKGTQASVVAHEILHLYGAEDLYATEARKALAKEFCANDIMLSTKYQISRNDIGAVTAFYVGWTDDVPSLLYREDF